VESLRDLPHIGALFSVRGSLPVKAIWMSRK
jgi:hypothetical protein